MTFSAYFAKITDMGAERGLPKGVYRVQPGQFGLVRYGRNHFHDMRPMFIDWYFCRESFHYEWNRKYNQTFFYGCPRTRVEAFIKKVEDKLGLWWRTKVYPTQLKRVCNVSPAPFWTSYPMRMSLFTILLRAALNYTPNQDWQDCLFKEPYAQETKEAILYFLDGHTKFKVKKCCGGWVRHFTQSKIKVENMLRRPYLTSIARWLLRKR